jgi:hypothetical protein
VTDETFTVVEKHSGETVTTDLKPGGADIAITEENKKEYVDLMVEYCISKRVKDQFDAFMSGFNELIPQDLITVFDERELELLIGGTSEIDVYVFLSLCLILIRVLRFYQRDDWAKFTNYRGYEVNDEVVQWFWKCLRSWPPERKSRLLQFATGTTRIPVSGFKDLQGSDGLQRFTVEKAGDPNQLPKNHTCFNRIDLPPYKDYASLEHKLTLAVECVSLSHVPRRYPLISMPIEKLLASDENRRKKTFCCMVVLYLTPRFDSSCSQAVPLYRYGMGPWVWTHLFHLYYLLVHFRRLHHFSASSPLRPAFISIIYMKLSIIVELYTVHRLVGQLWKALRRMTKYVQRVAHSFYCKRTPFYRTVRHSTTI